MTYATIGDMVDSSLYFSYRLGFYIAIGIITCIFFHISAGNIMTVLHTKEKRISYLMLPATQAEKFVSRALQVTLGTAILVLVALFSAEMTRLMLFPLLGASEVLQRFCLFNLNDIILKGAFLNGVEYIQDEKLMYLAVFNTCCFFIASHSCFILGGTYFYKRPIIKTFGLLILGSTILSFITSYFEIHSISDQVDYKIFLIISCILYLSIAATCWALSYFLFTRSQVTERINFKILKKNK